MKNSAIALFFVLALAQSAQAATYQYRYAAKGVVAAPTAPAAPSNLPPAGAVFARMVAPYQGSTTGLSVTHSYYGNWSLAQANIGKTSGKWYWEATRVQQASGALVGANPSQVSQNNYGKYMYHTGGAVYTPQGYSAPAIADGQTVGVLLDLDSRTLRYMPNCSMLSTVTSLESGTIYPSVAGQSGTKWTVNFGESRFVCDVPDGYKAGYWQ